MRRAAVHLTDKRAERERPANVTLHPLRRCSVTPYQSGVTTVAPYARTGSAEDVANAPNATHNPGAAV